MKKLILTLIMMLSVCGIARAQDIPDVNLVSSPGIAIWGVMDNSLERIIGLRAGYETDFKVEIGGTCLWQQTADWDATPDYYGVYLAYWIDELGFVADSDGFSGIEDLLHLLVAKPYALIEGLYDDPADDIRLGIGAGAAFYAKEDVERKIAITMEYVTIDGYEQKFNMGLRLKF